MTLKQRIRLLTDSLPKGRWLSTAEIRAHVGSTSGAVGTAISQMHQAEQLVRRGTNPPGCEYRSGPRPVVAVGRGSRPRARFGFMHLARLRESDPEAYEKEIAADRGRR